MKQHALIVLTSLYVLTACGGGEADSADATTATSAQTAASAPSPRPADGIDWFKGGVDDGFALARESGKPIYLYWGAVWCPPCYAINETVFKSPAFIERSKLFVPIYLDGDTERAQSVGERFGVLGYPTMIVFDSNGNELTRIPGGIDMQAYATVLDLTLSNSASAVDLVDKVLTGSAKLQADECTQLAYYSWGQDLTILAEHDGVAAFRQMYEQCPGEMQSERTILYFNWLDAALDASEAEEDAVPLPEGAANEALAVIETVLADPSLSRDNVFSVIFGGARYAAALSATGSDDRARLIAQFYEALNRLYADEDLYMRERLYTLAGKVAFERIDDPETEISAGLREEIETAARWADASTPNAWERQPIINALGNILEDAGMDEFARVLLLAELPISQQPYYFMTGLADIEQRAGDFEAALNWHRQAYDASRGPATRFQWGYYYLAGLLEMDAQNTRLIHDTIVQLIEELQQGGGLYQRPKAQLQRLEGRLQAWSEEHGGEHTLGRIRESVRAVCGNDPEAQSRETCQAFLDAA